MGPMTPNCSLPPGAWDSHVHVVDEDKFPLHPNHPYRPKKADLEDLLAFERTIGTDHVCLIAFSIYGNDNASILDALGRLNGKGRAVVCIDPDISTEKISAMHDLGVRGIRLNLRTRSEKVDAETFGPLLQQYADLLRPFGWAIQIYTSLDQVPLIAPHIPTLGVPVIFDHMASPEGDLPPKKIAGYHQLVELLKQKLIYVKLSGLYRLNTPGMEEYIREVLAIAPTQVVWASDWPHSGGASRNPDGDRKKVQEYRKVSIPDFIADCKRWCEFDDDLMNKLWVENPRRLWQYRESD